MQIIHTYRQQFIKSILFNYSFKNGPQLTAYQILGITEKANFSQVKQAYIKLTKLYHPDVNKSPDATEKFKKINQAYNELKDYYQDYYKKNPSAASDQEQGPQVQEINEKELYKSIFGKTYEEDPLAYYDIKNEHNRKRYEYELKMLKNKKFKNEQKDGKQQDFSQFKKDSYSSNQEQTAREFYSSPKYAEQQQAQYHQQREQTNVSGGQAGLLLGLFGAIGIFGIYQTIKSKQTDDAFKGKLQQEQVQIWRQQKLIQEEKKIEVLKQDVLQEQNPMKKYPVEQDPLAQDLLVDYTIFPDIKIYHVPFQYFYDDRSQYEQTNDFTKIPMQTCRINTLLTITLEAERVFQNIMITKKDVKKIIQEKGSFEPPGVFFRYFGFIYVRIRRKGIIQERLEKLNDNDKISLFDLFFDYYSPIPVVHNKWFEFQIRIKGFIYDKKYSIKEPLPYIGNVCFNPRTIPKLLIKGTEKNIFVWKGQQKDCEKEDRYIQTWKNHYEMLQHE